MTYRTDEPLMAGVELGGTKIVCLLAAGPEDVRDEVRIPTTTPEETLPAIAAVLEKWRAGSGFEALGVASFGPLDLDDRSPRFGQIVATPKPGWGGWALTALGENMGVPVVIDTDVNGAAFAEGRWGAARGLRSYAYVTVGTGIGVGSVIDGRPVRGLGHSEAGHLRVGRLKGDDWPGVCPYHGDCVEGLASGPAVAARAGRPGGALESDDPAWTMVVHALGGLLHNLVLTTAPERILIGGGVADGQAWLFPRLRAALIDSLAGYATADRIAAGLDAFVQPPGLGARAGPLGAIALARNALPG
ncbi:ROK family protein [Brevundimonas sp.]|uniref:ROK family protein n=1 Tax=Brevundimonas sp. TaxID=1871086 RepID=UPI002737F1BC|nr:ROK family protein [Brevundimonas sp.]MDP3803569.1 ROK family protein [Brevundimonas sp.]